MFQLLLWGWDDIGLHFGFPGWPAMCSQVDLRTQHAGCVPASPFPVPHTLLSPSPDGLPDSVALRSLPAEFSLEDSELGKGTLFCGLIHMSNESVGWVPVAACLQPRFRRVCDEGTS